LFSKLGASKLADSELFLVVTRHEQPTNKTRTPTIIRPYCWSKTRTPKRHSYSTTDLRPRPIPPKNTVHKTQASPEKKYQKHATTALRGQNILLQKSKKLPQEGYDRPPRPKYGSQNLASQSSRIAVFPF
jgi:hypothetical protein